MEENDQVNERQSVQIKDLIIVICLAFNNVIIAMNHTSSVFLNYKPNFKCKGYENLDACKLTNYTVGSETLNNDKSLETKNYTNPGYCEKFEYEVHNGEYSIVIEWSLVCDREIYSALCITLYFIAVAVGALITGILTDKYGRRTVMYSCIYAQGFVGILISMVANTYVTYAVLRFIQGLFIQGILSSTYLLINEALPAKHRTILTSVIEIFWGLGLILLACLAYLLPNWRYLNCAICLLPLMVATFSIWIVPESKVWLNTHNVTREAINLQSKKDSEYMNDDKRLTSLKRQVNRLHFSVSSELSTLSCAKYKESPTANKKPPLDTQSLNSDRKPEVVEKWKDNNETDSEIILYNSDISIEENMTDKKLNQEETIKDKQSDDLINGCSNSVLSQIKVALTNPVLRNRLFLMMLLWFTESLSYFGITFSIPILNGNHYVNFIISGIIEIAFFVIICCFIIKRGRQLTMALAFITSGSCYMIAGFLSNDAKGIIGYFRTFLVIFGKGCVMGNYMCLLLYTMELFPTNLRGMSLGLSLFCSQTGTFLSPIILLLEMEWPNIPFLIFSTLNINSGVFVYYLLPETQNAELPETIQEAVERVKK